MSKKIIRKEFLKQISILSAGALGNSVLISSCGEDEKKAPQAIHDPCDDLRGLSNTDKETRKTYGYVAASSYSDKACNNCNLFHPPTGGG